MVLGTAFHFARDFWSFDKMAFGFREIVQQFFGKRSPKIVKHRGSRKAFPN